MFCVYCHRPVRKQSLSPTAALAAAIESSLVRTWSNRDQSKLIKKISWDRRQSR